MNCPHGKEDDEEMMRVPEPVKVNTTCLFAGSESHGSEANEHNVARDTRTSGKVYLKECDNVHANSRTHCRGETSKVDPMSDGMDDCEKAHRPADRLVKGDIFVKGNGIV